MTFQKFNQDGNRRVENNRLVYYQKTATPEYWEDIWRKNVTAQMYEPYKTGQLFEFSKFFTTHLPHTGRILEAGCGSAQFVAALNARGYNCMGLDYAFHAMQRANQLAGPLRLICGDITTLCLANHSFDAVISIGVVEHRREGPEPFLDEMARILKPDGLMLISVPYFNPLRRWRARHGAYQDDVDLLEFYQYAYAREEFLEYLLRAGFEIEKFYTYAHQNTLRQELHWLKTLPEWLKNLMMRLSKYVPYVNSQLGHMLMVVARRKNG